jgi:hypothetical protein
MGGTKSTDGKRKVDGKKGTGKPLHSVEESLQRSGYSIGSETDIASGREVASRRDLNRKKGD